METNELKCVTSNNCSGSEVSASSASTPAVLAMTATTAVAFFPLVYNHSATEAAAAMAVFRRVVALAGKINPWSAAKNELTGRQTRGGRARRCLAAGMCLASGGVVAVYFYNDLTSDRARKKRIGIHGINGLGLLPSMLSVEAKEKVETVLCLLL